jgi:cytochrome P450
VANCHSVSWRRGRSTESTCSSSYSATLHTLVAGKRQTPGDDLTSGLISVHDEDGARLTEAELVDTLILLPIQSFISNGHATLQVRLNTSPTA